VLENHRLEMEDGCPSDDLLGWVKEEQPNFDWKTFGFQEFSEMLNFAQDKGVVRIQPDEERGLLVFLGAEFHPPAVAEPVIPMAIAEPEEERQPVVKGQPTAREPRVKRTTRKTVARAPSLASALPVPESDGDNVGNAAETGEPKKATRKMPTKRAGTRRIVKTAPAPQPEAQPEAPAEGSTEE
jgi:hypothetical protein